MSVLVSDTWVLIDLERGSFIHAVFGLPFRLVVPDLLYERELKRHGGPALRKLGLCVAALDGEGAASAINYRRMRPALSMADVFALALAARNGWSLLTGDRVLRGLATAEHVTCRGLLWLLDQMLESGVADRGTLHPGLTAINSHPRSRLPAKEVQARLECWLQPPASTTVHRQDRGPRSRSASPRRSPTGATIRPTPTPALPGNGGTFDTAMTLR